MVGVDPEGSSLGLPEEINKEREGEGYQVGLSLFWWYTHRGTLWVNLMKIGHFANVILENSFICIFELEQL